MLRSPTLKPVRYRQSIALSLLRSNSRFARLQVEGGRVARVDGQRVDGVVAAADYRHVEQQLLPKEFRSVSDAYWREEAVMSPSTLLFYLGFDRKVEGLLHHTFFFSQNLQEHFDLVFSELASEAGSADRIIREGNGFSPLFYVSATSKTDHLTAAGNSSSSSGGEAVFVLVPVPFRFDEYETQVLAGDKQKIDEARQQVLAKVMTAMADKLALPDLAPSLVYEKAYGPSEFAADFNSHRGNAFGHANTALDVTNSQYETEKASNRLGKCNKIVVFATVISFRFPIF